MMWLDLEPPGTPLAERIADRAQGAAHLGEVVGGAAAVILRGAD